MLAVVPAHETSHPATRGLTVGEGQARVNGVCAAAGSGSSLPQAHGGLLGGFSQRSVFAAQHEFSSLRQLEVGGVIHR